VKRTDVAGARYDFVKSVDPEQNVAEFIARWMAQAKLDVDPSLVTLRLVPCGARKPTAEEEQTAAEVDPFDTLATAGVADSCKLLAVVAGALDRCCGSACFSPDALPALSLAASEPKLDVAALESRLKVVEKTVNQEVKSQSLSTRTLAELYRDQPPEVLQPVKLPTWFAPDLTAPTNLWTPLPSGALEDKVQKLFESAVRPLAAASPAPTIVLVGSSTKPSIGRRKPDMVGRVAAAPAAAAALFVEPLSPFVTHIACVGSLKRKGAMKASESVDGAKGGALDFADALMRKQPWRAHDGSLARVIAFLSDGEYIVFFECTFRVEVRGQALRVRPTAVRECAPLPLNGLGGAYLAGLTRAPLDALGYCLPQCEVGGAPVALHAYLGMGATSHGFAGTWRGDEVVMKRYHAHAPAEDAAALERAELDALAAARGVRGVCHLLGTAASCLLLAPRGVVAYSLHVRRAAPAAPAPAGLWSPACAAADPPAPPADEIDPVRPGAAEFCDLVDALAGLHAVGWCHRDPRPANFFRDAAGRFFLADLGSAARIGDADAAADGRKWAPQYGPLAALRAAATGAPPPAPAPAHDFEQVARLVYACVRGNVDAVVLPDDRPALVAWWEERDSSLSLKALLPAAAAAAQGDAARRAFQDVIRQVLL
jgi:hypothetical protein